MILDTGPHEKFVRLTIPHSHSAAQLVEAYVRTLPLGIAARAYWPLIMMFFLSLLSSELITFFP